MSDYRLQRRGSSCIGHGSNNHSLGYFLRTSKHAANLAFLSSFIPPRADLRPSAFILSSIRHICQPRDPHQQRDDRQRRSHLAVVPKRDSTPWRLAFSTTIKLATEPRTVKFPASVLDMASVSHAVSRPATGIDWAIGSSNRTAGTLLTRFDRAAEIRLSRPTGWLDRPSQRSMPQCSPRGPERRGPR